MSLIIHLSAHRNISTYIRFSLRINIDIRIYIASSRLRDSCLLLLPIDGDYSELRGMEQSSGVSQSYRSPLRAQVVQYQGVGVPRPLADRP